MMSTWSGSCTFFGSDRFFFQAEDGIRYPLVTGVQTCALPIFPGRSCAPGVQDRPGTLRDIMERREMRKEIGRASCRERVYVAELAGGVEKKANERKGRRAGGYLPLRSDRFLQPEVMV